MRTEELVLRGATESLVQPSSWGSVLVTGGQQAAVSRGRGSVSSEVGFSGSSCLGAQDLCVPTEATSPRQRANRHSPASLVPTCPGMAVLRQS